MPQKALMLLLKNAHQTGTVHHNHFDTRRIHMESQNPYNHGLDQNAANYDALSPLSFIERTAVVHPQLTSVIYHQRRFTWAQTYQRCKQLASALSQKGIGEGDTVSTMLPNIPAMYEAHFGVPMTGAVLNTLNI